jgi:hypothetical protein
MARNTKLKESWEKWIDSITESISDKAHVDVQIMAGDVRALIAPEGFVKWDEVLAATIAADDASVRLLVATRVNVIDGDCSVVIDEGILDGSLEYSDEMYSRIMNSTAEALDMGLALRKQWIEWTQNLIALATKLAII